MFDTVERAKREAQYALEDLGISVKDKDGKWEDLTLKVINNKHDHDDEDDDDKDDDKDDDEDDSADKEEDRNEQGLEFMSKEELQENVLNLQRQDWLRASCLKNSKTKK